MNSKKNSSIFCGKYNFCVSTENDNENYHCYGSKDRCLWDSNDCTKDSDCSKYNSNSTRYTDIGMTCSDFKDKSIDGWASDTCATAKNHMKDPNSNIFCGKYNFCVSTENNNENYHCYGSKDRCLWDSNDCTKDSDCSKYNSNSTRYTDIGNVCSMFKGKPIPMYGWAQDTCATAKNHMKSKSALYHPSAQNLEKINFKEEKFENMNNNNNKNKNNFAFLMILILLSILYFYFTS